jgi:zinc protease
LKDVLKNPSFSKTEFEKIVLENKTNMETYKNDPQNVAFSTLSNKLCAYPKGHAYYSPTIDERLSNLEATKLEDIKMFYNSFLGVNEGYISFVGDVQKDIVINKMNEIFNGWTPKIPYTKIPHRFVESKKDIQTIQIPDKSNAVSAGTMNLMISEQDPDYPALYMVNELLGSGAFLSSRIPQRLREAEGMSYGAGSFLNAEWDEKVGSLGTYAFFNPSFKDKLNAALMDELVKASQGTFTEKELSDSKTSLIQERKIGLGDNNFLVRQMINYMYNNTDLKYYDEFGNKIQNLTLQQVNEAAKKYLNLDKFMLIYTGDFSPKK